MRGAAVALGIALAILLAGRPAAAADPWDQYHAAFLRLANGENQEARRLLEEIVRQYPGHPAAVQAQARLADFAGAAPGRPIDEVLDPLRQERPTRAARAELVLFQTIHGIFVGNEVCVMAGCDSVRAGAAATMLGGAAGVGASLYLTRGNVHPGRAEAIDSGVIWGAANAGAVLDNQTAPSDATVAGWLLGGQIAGLAAGDLAYRVAKPTAGQVAEANTAGFWTAILVLFAHGAADKEPAFDTVILSADAGVGLGALAASRYPMSRGRTYLIDAGGVVGMLGGLLIAVGTDDGQAAFTSLFIGTALGLAGGVFLTRNWDAPAASLPHVALMPVRGGGFGATLVFDLH